MYKGWLDRGHLLWTEEWSKEKRLREELEKDCLGEFYVYSSSNWKYQAILLHQPPPSLCILSADPPKRPEGDPPGGCEWMWNEKWPSRGSNYRISDLEKAKFQQTLCYLLENAFLPNAFTLFSSINIVGVFSLRCSFFDMFQKLEG